MQYTVAVLAEGPSANEAVATAFCPHTGTAVWNNATATVTGIPADGNDDAGKTPGFGTASAAVIMALYAIFKRKDVMFHR
jgi:hypothetical protein